MKEIKHMNMKCKHRQLIRITNNKKEYYCLGKGKEIKDFECNSCMLYLPDFNNLFGEKFDK